MSDLRAKTCKGQLPDNGDTYTCNLPVVRGDYCHNCLPRFYGRAWDRFNAAVAELQQACVHLLELEEPKNRMAFINLTSIALTGLISTLREKVG